MKDVLCCRCGSIFKRSHLWLNGPGFLCDKCRGRDRLDEQRIQRALARLEKDLSTIRWRGICLLCGSSADHDESCPAISVPAHANMRFKEFTFKSREYVGDKC